MKAKKILAALLSSAMVLGAASIPVFAEGVTTAADFKTAIAQGGTVELDGDITLSEYIPIIKDVTIKGNGHTISSSASRILRVSENDVSLTIENTNFVGINNKAERGLQVDGGKTGVKWNFSNISVTGITYYTLNICNDASVTIDAKNSTFSGWGAFNGWSHGYVAEFDNCTFNGYNDKNYNADGWNDFGTFVLEGDTTGATDMAASNCRINLNNCKINASTSGQGNKQYAITFNNPSASNIINITGDETVVTCESNGILVPEVINNNKLNIKAGTYNVDPQAYLADGYVETVSAGTYTVNALNSTSITNGTVKTSIANGEYDQLTADTTTVNNDKTKITYTIEDSNGKSAIKEYNYSSFENFSGDIVYGLILTGIPEDIDVTVTSVIE